LFAHCIIVWPNELTWNDQLVIDQLAQDADQLIGGKKDSCLIIDKSGIQKKGPNQFVSRAIGADSSVK
jgi:hypothetical protein